MATILYFGKISGMTFFLSSFPSLLLCPYLSSWTSANLWRKLLCFCVIFGCIFKNIEYFSGIDWYFGISLESDEGLLCWRFIVLLHLH